MIFEPGQRIVFIGDSITDCGRRDIAAPFGNGYMSLVRAFVIADHPSLDLTWVNRGISGDTVRDLARRWQTDAIDEQPSWLSVMIGINDIWRAHTPGRSAEAVPLPEYTSTLRDLLRQVVSATGCRLIVADPYFIEPDPAQPQRADTDRYCAVVASLAAEFDAVHVPTQAAFAAVLAHTTPADWADDQVHPNLPGHAVIARSYLDVISRPGTSSAASPARR